MYYLDVQGTRLLSSATNLYYLAERVGKWFRYDIPVHICHYPTGTKLLTVTRSRIIKHFHGEGEGYV